MSRLLLVHWNATEAAERARRLRRAGYRADFYADQRGTAYRTIRDNPPDAFVIDLSRVPSHGRALGVWLRQQKATRHRPIVFVEGEPEKVAQTRALLPDAVYTDWRHIRSAVRAALRNPPAAPIVPATMQGYSATPLPKKLGIRAGSVVALLGAPAGFERRLGTLPENIRLVSRLGSAADLILLFARSRAELERRFGSARRALAEGGGIWIAWPKQASGVSTDLTQNEVRAFGLRAGLVDYKVCAIDPTWSGLLFARRRG